MLQQIADKLALEGEVQLDSLVQTLQAHRRGGQQRPVDLIVVERLVRRAVEFMQTVAAMNVMVVMVKPDFVPYSTHRSVDADVVTLIDSVRCALESTNDADLHWWLRNHRVRTLRFDISKLSGSSTFCHVRARLRDWRGESHGEDPTATASRVESASSRLPNPQGDSMASKTMDLSPAKVRQRHLFDYYVYSVKNDDLISTGSLIVQAIDADAAHAALQTKLQAKLAESGVSDLDGLRLHVRQVDSWTVPEEKPADDLTTAIQDLTNVMRSSKAG